MHFIALPIKVGTTAALFQSQRKGPASFGNISSVFFPPNKEKKSEL